MESSWFQGSRGKKDTKNEAEEDRQFVPQAVVWNNSYQQPTDGRMNKGHKKCHRACWAYRSFANVTAWHALAKH